MTGVTSRLVLINIGGFSIKVEKGGNPEETFRNAEEAYRRKFCTELERGRCLPPVFSENVKKQIRIFYEGEK